MPATLHPAGKKNDKSRVSSPETSVVFNYQGMTPVINGVPPLRAALYQTAHPSVNLALPPSIHHTDRCQTGAASSIGTPRL